MAIFGAPSSIPMGDIHMRSLTFLYDIQFSWYLLKSETLFSLRGNTLKNCLLFSVQQASCTGCAVTSLRFCLFSFLLFFSKGGCSLEVRQHQTKTVWGCVCSASMDCTCLPCTEHQKNQASLIDSLYCNNNWWISLCNAWGNSF